MLVQLNSLYEPCQHWSYIFIPLLTSVRVYSNRDYKVVLTTATRIEKESGEHGIDVDEYVGNI